MTADFAHIAPDIAPEAGAPIPIRLRRALDEVDLYKEAAARAEQQRAVLAGIVAEIGDVLSPTGERPEEALGTLVADVQAFVDLHDVTEEQRDEARAELAELHGLVEKIPGRTPVEVIRQLIGAGQDARAEMVLLRGERDQANELTDKIAAEKRRTTREREALARRCAVRFEEIQALKAELASARQELDLLTADNARLTGELEQVRAELAELRAVNEQQRRDLTEALDELEQLHAAQSTTDRQEPTT